MLCKVGGLIEKLGVYIYIYIYIYIHTHNGMEKIQFRFTEQVCEVEE